MTSRRLSIRSVAPSATVWPSFEMEFGVPQFWGFGEKGVGRSANRKPTHDFPIPLNTKFSICRRLAAIPKSSYDLPIRSPTFGGLK